MTTDRSTRRFAPNTRTGAARIGARVGCSDPAEPIGANLYGRRGRQLPDAAVLASLGCGNPTAVAELQPGERVLDLGSGGGIDVMLAASRVGPRVARSGST